VGLDHADYAGGGRDAIAAEKIGIVKPGATLVLGETDPDLLPVFAGAGAERTWLRGDDYDLVASETAVGGRMVDLRTPGATYPGLFLPVHGVHQAENAATALAAVETFFDRALDPETVGDGLAAVGLPGRFEVVGRQPLVVLDPAHNPAAAEAVATTLEDGFSVAGDTVLVVGTTRGHGDPMDLLAALGAGEARLVVACAPDWPRAVPAEEIAAAAGELGAAAVVVPDVADAVDRGLEEAGPDDAVLVTGSFYVVGEARPRFRPTPP
jgi:dihydrofolate synthase / folylpolyglutamate synthase